MCLQRLGNTGGLGGAFGLLHAIGVDFPYPEGKPWQSSWQQVVSGGHLAHEPSVGIPHVMLLGWLGELCACPGSACVQLLWWWANSTWAPSQS